MAKKAAKTKEKSLRRPGNAKALPGPLDEAVAAALIPEEQSLEALKRDYFLPYQWKWIKDESALKLYPKSRRVGITYATSYRCVRKCLRKKGFTQWVSSKDLLLAREFVTEYVAKWCKLANVVASGLEGETLEVIDPEKDVTAYIVRFPNGNRIVSLSSNPNAFAGKGGDVLLDEVDLHDDSGILIDMATPCTMWGGQLEIVSAYDADGSTETPFAKLCEEVEEHGNPMGWSYHKTDIDDAIAQGLVEKIDAVRKAANPDAYKPLTRESFRAECRAKCRTEAAWLSQYKCMPVNAIGQKVVSPTDLLAAKEMYPIVSYDVKGNAKVGQQIDPSVNDLIAAIKAEPLQLAGRLIIGYDVARKGDLSSVWVDDEFAPGKFRLQMLILMHNCKLPGQGKLIETLMDMYPRAVGAGDSTGLGQQVVESLYDTYPKRWLMVNFSAHKRDLGTLMTQTFEEIRQVIPVKPAYISADIACLEKGVTTGGRLVYVEKENRLRSNSHADMAWSCALAKFAASELASGPFEWQSREPAGKENPMLPMYDPLADEFDNPMANSEAFI